MGAEPSPVRRPGAADPSRSARLDSGDPAADLADWLGSVDLSLMEAVDTGLHRSAARGRVDDYIELRYPGWPDYLRLHLCGVDPSDDVAWLCTEYVARDGLDALGSVQPSDAGTLLA